MSTINFGGVEETVVTRDEISVEQAKETLKDETIAILGYGVQGPAQSMNLRDNGFNVIIGQRKGSASWDQAVKDGWVEGETLFGLAEAAEKGTFICNLLSDAGAMHTWKEIEPALTEGKAICFSHGFAVAYGDITGVLPPKNIDVVLVAPKGSGKSVRRLFEQGKGINSSYAVYQDASGKALDRVLAYGIGIGSGYLFETTFENEVTSDLVGERGVLMGALAGIIEAQYNVLRRHGHSPSEAFNETVEELTQSLVPLVGENGMDWMYANCSTTAQRGALDWKGEFRKATEDVFERLYQSVESKAEAKRVIEKNSQDDYREKLGAELAEIRESELWQAGAAVRKLRP